MLNSKIAIRSISLIFLFQYALIIQAQEKSPWVLEKEVDNIIIYSRVIPGYQIKEVKLETTVDFSIQEILEVLTDFDHQDRWLEGCINGQLMQRPSNDEYVFYAEMNAPWPVLNRDVVAKATLDTLSSNEYNLSIESVDGYVEPKKNIVRMPMIMGNWNLLTAEDGKTNVTYMAYGDPGGSIPNWLVNAKLLNDPIRTFKNLFSLLSEKRK